jgi:hypothetical protein
MCSTFSTQKHLSAGWKCNRGYLSRCRVVPNRFSHSVHQAFSLKRLSLAELGLSKGCGLFLNFLGAPMILQCKKYMYCG